MSDRRRQIAEQLQRENHYFDSNAVMIVSIGKVESAMSEYAAALLEDVAQELWRNGAEPIKSMRTKRAQDREYALKVLRARAAQERAR